MRRGVLVVRSHGVLFCLLLLVALALTGGGVLAVLGPPGNKELRPGQTSTNSPASTANHINEAFHRGWRESVGNDGPGPDRAAGARLGKPDLDKRIAETGERSWQGQTNTPVSLSANPPPIPEVSPALITERFPTLVSTPDLEERMHAVSRLLRAVPFDTAIPVAHTLALPKAVGQIVATKSTTPCLLADLNIADDYPVFCATLGIAEPGEPGIVQAVDMNSVATDAGGGLQFLEPNGIPDVMELHLLESALQDTDYSAGSEETGDLVTHEDLVQRWNEIEAEFVMAEGAGPITLDGKDDSFKRIVIAYCMLGDIGSLICGTGLAAAKDYIPRDENSSNVLLGSSLRRFSCWGDADGDLFGNITEWDGTSGIASFSERKDAYLACALSDVNRPSGAYCTVSYSATGMNWCVYPVQMRFPAGMAVALPSVPRYPWMFGRWIVDGLPRTGRQLRLSVTHDTTVHAEYVMNPYSCMLFEDKRLEQAVRVALNRFGTDNLTCEDWLSGNVAKLDASGLGITSLVGAEQLIGLTECDLHDNRIACLTPLSGLTSLTRLDLGHNQIADIGPLATLTGLTYLELGRGNPLDESTDILNMPAVGNHVVDISPLHGSGAAPRVGQLAYLGISGNAIADLSPLVGMEHLKTLFTEGNPATVLSPLAGIASLRTLGLGGAAITQEVLGTGEQSLLNSLTHLEQFLLRDAPAITALPTLSSTVTGVGCLDTPALTDISALGALSSLSGVIFLNTGIDGDDLVVFQGKALSDGLTIPNNRVTELNRLVSSGFTASSILLNGNPLYLPVACPQMDTLRNAGTDVIYEDNCCDPTAQTLTAQVNPNGTGGIMPWLGPHLVKPGDTIHLQAIQSNTQYAFSNWSGDISGSEFNTSVLMPARAVTVTANFAPVAYTLTMLAPEGAGTVTPSSGVVRFASGQTRYLNAEAKPGWVFKNWTYNLDASPEGSGTFFESTPCIDCNPTLAGRDVTVQAHFSSADFTLDISHTGSGVIAPADGRHYYNSAAWVSLNALPADGWYFDRWDGDLIYPFPSAAFAMTQNMSVTGIFSGQLPSGDVVLTVHARGHGSTSPPVGVYRYLFTTPCQEVELCATPDAGWQFDHWEGEVSANSNPTTVVMGQTKTVTAVFTEDTILFADANLEGAVRDAIHKPGGDIHASDLVGHGDLVLDASGIQINSLEGLQYWTDLAGLAINNPEPPTVMLDLRHLPQGLRYLSLENVSPGTVEPATTLEPLAFLEDLELLVLRNCGLTDITSLQTMTGLKYLDLAQNQISNLAPLQGLSLLQGLDLSMNGDQTGVNPAFSSLAPLSGLTELRNLILSANRLEDVSLLAENTGLGADDLVDLSDNTLSQTSLCGAVQTLEGRGAEVLYEGVCNNHALVVHTIGEGTVSKSPDRTDYEPDTVVALTAVPASARSSHFDHWEGDLNGTENPASVTMDGDKDVTAVFLPHDYTLNVEVVGNGSVTPGTGVHYHIDGDIVSFSVLPAPGHMLDHWEGDLSGTDHNPMLVMDRDRSVKAVFTEGLLRAGFRAEPAEGTAPLNVRFMEQTAWGDEPVTAWLWDFGDGVAGTEPSPTHVYQNPGTYTVSLTVTTATGRTDTAVTEQCIRAHSLPTASFSASPFTGPEGLEVSFKDTSLPGDLGPILHWKWNFGDGNTREYDLSDKPAAVAHVYGSAGVYTVALTVRTAAGSNTATKAGYIHVHPLPNAAFSAYPRGGRAPLDVQFSDESTSESASPITRWEWDFGDGATSGLQSPKHTYTSAGTYEVSLTVENLYGKKTHSASIYAIDNLARFYVVPPNSSKSSKTQRDGTSWATAFTSISEAAAQLEVYPDAEIWIAQGVYREAVEIGGSHVWLYGGFAGTEDDPSERELPLRPTIVDGGQPVETIPAGYTMGIFLLSGEMAVVDGLTVAGSSDSGVVVGDHSNATISRCVFAGNADEGVYLSTDQMYDSGLAEISECVVSGNGRGIVGNRKQAIVKNTLVTGNKYCGVAIEDPPGWDCKNRRMEPSDGSGYAQWPFSMDGLLADDWGPDAWSGRKGNALSPAVNMPFVDAAGRMTKADGAEWTILVYMDGDNNLEGSAVADFLEMSEIGSSNEVNVVVLFDRSPDYVTAYGDWSGARRGIVHRGDKPDLAWATPVGDDVDMGSTTTLQSFCEWGMSAYPADQYALILWNHGGGWSKSVMLPAHPFKEVCYDDTSGSVLRVRDVKEAIRAATSGRSPLSLIGFDACLMGMAEVAYSMGLTGASVMVASEELEPSEGWPYSDVLQQLEGFPGMDPAELGTVIVDAYYRSYGGSQTMSAVNLAKMGSVMAGIADLGAAVRNDWDNNASVCAAKAQSLMATLDSAVISERHGNAWAGSGGLSIYFPGSTLPAPEYQDIDSETVAHWYDFLQAFAGLRADSWVRTAREGVPTYGPLGEYADLYAFCAAMVPLAQENSSCLKIVNCTVANQQMGLFVYEPLTCQCINTIFSHHCDKGVQVVNAEAQLENCLFFQNNVDFFTREQASLAGAGEIDAHFNWQCSNIGGDPKFNSSPYGRELPMSAAQPDDVNRVRFSAPGSAVNAAVGRTLRLPSLEDDKPRELLIVSWTNGEIEAVGPMAAVLRGMEPGERPPVFFNLPDYHITEGSAALDNARLDKVPPNDMDGEVRPGSDGMADIGADEADSSWEGGPETEIYSLPEKFRSMSFLLPYRVLHSSASITGVSVKYRRRNGDVWGDWQEYQPNTPNAYDPNDLTIPFDAGTTGGEGYYEFYSIASDANGNREEDLQIADAGVLVVREYPDNRIYVDREAPGGGLGKSWSDAINGADGLCRALDLAEELEIPEIWVAQGNYEPIETAYTVLRSNVAVYGGFAGSETSLSQRDIAAHPSTISGGSGIYAVLYMNAIKRARLNGFTVAGADAVVGLCCARVADDVVIEDCTITGTAGMGVYLERFGSPQILNCSIQDNAWVGVYADVSAFPRIAGCQIHGNSGRGVWSVGPPFGSSFPEEAGASGAEIDNCAICANGLDGVIGSEGSNISLRNCILANNGSPGTTEVPATGNVNLYQASSVSVENCVIVEGCSYGVLLGSGNVVNCTIVGNAGPGISSKCGRLGPAEIVNCILANNAGAGIKTYPYFATSRAESCLFHGNSGHDYADGTAAGQCDGAPSLSAFLGRSAAPVDGDPHFAAPVTGTWGQISRGTAPDNEATLVLEAQDPQAFSGLDLVGHRIKVKAGHDEWIRICANTAGTVTVRANDVRCVVSPGDSFETDDYHLQNGSNALGRGHGRLAPSEDIDGEPRPQEDGVDIGADEAPSGWTAYPEAYLLNAPAVAVANDVCMEYVLAPGSGTIASLDLYYRHIGQTNWVSGGEYPASVDSICFTAPAEGVYELCLVAHGELPSSETVAEARVTVANALAGCVYVNDKATSGQRTGTSWENAFLTISDGVMAAECAGVPDVLVAGGPYFESIEIPSGVKVQGGYVRIAGSGAYARIGHTDLYSAAPEVSTPGPIDVIAGGTLAELLDIVTPTVTMTGAGDDSPLINAGLSGFNIYPALYFVYSKSNLLYGQGNCPSGLDLALKMRHAAPSTEITDCTFAGYPFKYDITTFQYDHTYAIFCSDASPSLDNCVFDRFVDAVCLEGTGTPVMEDCAWTKSSLRALSLSDSVDLQLRRCTLGARVVGGGETQIHMENSTFDGAKLILGGEATGNVAECAFEGPMEVKEEAIATITSTTFVTDGAAIRIESKQRMSGSEEETNRIRNCLFQGNAKMAIWCGQQSHAEFENCVVAGNGLSSEDAAIWIQGCSPVFRNCTIADNAGTGVHIERPYYDSPETHPAFQNCIISDQHGNEGVGISCYRDVDVNIFAGQDPDLRDSLPNLQNCLFYGNDGGDLAVHEGGDGVVTRVYGKGDINAVTGSTTTIWGDPKFVEGLSGTWGAIGTPTAELSLQAAADYVEAGDLSGRFLVANCTYARQTRILRNPTVPLPVHNTIVIPYSEDYLLARNGEDDVTLRKGLNQGDMFRVVDYHLRDGSMAVDGGDAGVAPSQDADGQGRTGPQVSIGAYEPPQTYVPGTPGPYTRVTELRGMVEGIIVGFNFDIGFTAVSVAQHPITHVQLWYRVSGGAATLYGTVPVTENPIHFNADETGDNATGTKAGFYSFYTIGVTDIETEGAPRLPDAVCEVVAPWDGVTPICVARDALSEEDWRGKTGADWTQENAFQALGNAIERARIYKVGEIWMKEGEYPAITIRNRGDVAIYGGFEGMGTPGVDETKTSRDAVAHLTKIVSESWVGTYAGGEPTPPSLWLYQTKGLLLDGIMLSRGLTIFECDDSNTIQNCTIKNIGGCVAHLGSASPAFSHCTFASDIGTYCQPDEFGPCSMTDAWSAVTVGGGSPTFTDCVLDGAFWCAVEVVGQGSPTFTQCRILSRQPDPSGTSMYRNTSRSDPFIKSVVSCSGGAAPTFASCTIAGSAQAGVYVYGLDDTDDETPPAPGTAEQSPMFDDCVISVGGVTPWKSHLRKEGCGVLCCKAETKPQFRRCRIQGNYVGVNTVDSAADFANCIISDNGRSYADELYLYLEGAGIVCAGGPAPSFTHCTISDNVNVAVDADCTEMPSLLNCIISGVKGDEAVSNRRAIRPALKYCLFQNPDCVRDYVAYKKGVLVAAAKGATELAKTDGITAPVAGEEHFSESREVGWWGDAPNPVLGMTKLGACTRFARLDGGGFPGAPDVGGFVLAVSGNGGYYAKTGLVVATTGSTFDVLGDFTEKQDGVGASLHVVVPDYHIGNGSRALSHGIYCGAVETDLDEDPRPGFDSPLVDIGADEHVESAWRPEDARLLTIQCPFGGTTSPEAGVSVHEAESTVLLSAVDTEDRAFVRWQELAGSPLQVIAEHTEHDLSVTMSADRTFAAVFGQTVAITIEKTGVGETTPLPGTYTHAQHARVTVTASAVEGFPFLYWTDANGVLGTDPELTITVETPRTLRAVFGEEGAVCGPPLP